jgi:ketosteroid isomerase-like protein
MFDSFLFYLFFTFAILTNISVTQKSSKDSTTNAVKDECLKAAAKQQSTFAPVSPEMRKFILAEREKVWRAFFSNDKAALAKYIPEEIITMSPGQQGFNNRAEVLESSERFVKRGAKLVRLEFSDDLIQVYGAAIIIYNNYLYETEEADGKKTITSGRATDMFVMRDNTLVNVGWHLDSGK